MCFHRWNSDNTFSANYYYRINFYKVILNLYYYSSDSTKERHKNNKRALWPRLAVRKVIKSMPNIVIEWVHRRLETLLCKYNFDDERLVCNFLGIWGQKEIVPNKYFSIGQEFDFEKYSFIGVEKAHSYLRKIYGDYMKLPPPEQRVSHHRLTVLRTTNPCSNE